MNSWRLRKDWADSIAKAVDQEMDSRRRMETKTSAARRWEICSHCVDSTLDGSFVDVVAGVEDHC